MTDLGSCPGCGEPFTGRWEAIADSDDVLPVPGAAHVCLNCSHLTVYSSEGTLRLPTARELRSLMRDPEVRVVMQAVRKVMAKRGRKPSPQGIAPEAPRAPLAS
jgi:hypothetical protein